MQSVLRGGRYNTLSKYVRDNEAIPDDRKYDVYLTMKKLYIEKSLNRYKYLCDTINGSCDRTGQCAITCEYARELFKCSEEMNATIEILIAEHITELQGGMIVL